VGDGHFLGLRLIERFARTAVRLYPENKKPVQLAAERVPVENRFSGILSAPQAVGRYAPTRVKSALLIKVRATACVVNSGA
jgi:hypothetical protein